MVQCSGGDTLASALPVWRTSGIPATTKILLGVWSWSTSSILEYSLEQLFCRFISPVPKQCDNTIWCWCSSPCTIPQSVGQCDHNDSWFVGDDDSDCVGDGENFTQRLYLFKKNFFFFWSGAAAFTNFDWNDWTMMIMMAILPLPAALHHHGDFSNVANFFPIFKRG